MDFLVKDMDLEVQYSLKLIITINRYIKNNLKLIITINSYINSYFKIDYHRKLI